MLKYLPDIREALSFNEEMILKLIQKKYECIIKWFV